MLKCNIFKIIIFLKWFIIYIKYLNIKIYNILYAMRYTMIHREMNI